MNFSEYVNDNVLYLSGQLELKIDQLIKFLQRKTNIEHLCLSNCKIDDQGAEALAKSENLKNLTSLNLRLNNIGHKGAEALAKSENLKNLTSLNLSENNIGDEGAKELSKLLNLTRLNLSENNIGDEGAKELAKLSNLTVLNLSENNIGDEGAKELTKLTNLIYLDLSENNIGDEGAKVLIKALNDGKFPDLDFLDLKNKDISTGIEKKLYNALEFNIKHADHIRTNKSKLPIITACAGLLLGLGVAYLAGAATLTPVGAAVAVFIAAVVVGALIGYGLGKFCEKVSEKKQKDPDMSTWGAVKSVFSDVFTAGHSKQQELQA